MHNLFVKQFVIALFCVFILFSSAVHASIIYHHFERQQDKAPNDIPYYWGFDGVVVELSSKNDPVRSGKYALAVAVPHGQPLAGGFAVLSQDQPKDMNFIPECYDRFSFSVWSDPSQEGDHTVLVKFYDQNVYREQGFGVWTEQRATYHNWTEMSILFNQLPDDFDLEHVQKVEFFHYWDGMYYYDDIEIKSALTEEANHKCLKRQRLVVCDREDVLNCVTIYSQDGERALNYLQWQD